MYKKACGFVALALIIASLIGLSSSLQFSGGFVRFLQERTISEDEIPVGGSFDIIYILGGSQSSLQEKYARLCSLSHKIEYKKIIILDRPGITEYSVNVGRNLTNNEWSFMQLDRYRIKREDVELLSIQKGYFGTLSEARTVAGLMKKRGYHTVLLITAPHHTARVKKSFSYLLSGINGVCPVSSSAEEAPVGELLIENLKLLVYTFILLPMAD
jgi:hypothetical protein